MAGRGQSQGPDAGPDSRSAGFPPPHPPVSPVSPPPHPIGHLEGHLAGRRRVTWWWVSPISPVSPIRPPAPLGPHSRVATRRLPLLRGGGLPGLILAPGTPLLTPRVPFLLTPLVTPYLTPLVTPLPLVTTLVPLVIPVIPVVPVVPGPQGLPEVGFRFLPGAEEKLSRHPEGAPLFLPLPLLPLLRLLPPLPLPIGPLRHHPQLPRVQLLIPIPQHRHLADAPPIAPLPPRDIPGVPHTQHIPIGVPAPFLQGGGLGLGGGGWLCPCPWPGAWPWPWACRAALGGGGLFVATLEVAGSFLGGLGGGGLGGVSSPRRWCWCSCCCCCWCPPPSPATSPNPCAAGPCPPHSCPLLTYPNPPAPRGPNWGPSPSSGSTW